jgi:hypothetical protein
MADFRSDLFANGVPNGLYVPWLLGEFVPDWILRTEPAVAGPPAIAIGPFSNSKALTRDIINTVALQPNNAWVTAQAISGDAVLAPNPDTGVPTGQRNWQIHFSSESLVRFGVRYYNVYNAIMSKSVASISKITYDAVSPTQLYVSFSVTNDRVTKFVLEVYSGNMLVTSTTLNSTRRYYNFIQFNSEETYTIKITPYYNDLVGTAFTKTYTPTPSNVISSLNMRIISHDNLTMTDTVGSRNITDIESSANKYFVGRAMNIDHNGNARLMYVHNGGGLSVGGDVAAGDYSLSLWIKPSSSLKLPIIDGNPAFNTGLIGFFLNGASGANTTKTLLSLASTGILGAGVFDANNSDFTILLSGSTAGGGYDDAFYQPGWKKSTNMRADGWLHLVTTFNNTSKIRTVYINGQAYGSDSKPAHVNNGLLTSAGRTLDSIFIGTTPGLSVSQTVNNFSLYGFTNDIRMYTKELTPGEVKNIYTLNY